jgi:hypothetical protein
VSRLARSGKGCCHAKDDAQAVVLEILRQADGEWSGKAKLFKAFYFAHLYYANERPGVLTDWPIARLPQGPGIHNSEALFGELIREGLLIIEPVHEGPFPEYRYRLTEKGAKAAALPDDAVLAIRLAVLFCKDRTAAELTQITHDRSRSWINGKDGDILDIDIDTIPDEEYAREKELQRLDSCLTQILREEHP